MTSPNMTDRVTARRRSGKRYGNVTPLPRSAPAATAAIRAADRSLMSAFRRASALISMTDRTPQVHPARR